MLILAVAIGLILGVLAGGSFSNLLSVKLRYGLPILLALLLRFGGLWLVGNDVLSTDWLLPISVTSFTILIGALWLNRSEPGLLLVMAGTILNLAVIAINGGQMPVYVPALEVAGLGLEDVSATANVLLPETLDIEFLLRAGPLGDVLPLPLPLLPNVLSIGDFLIATGIAWYLFAAVSRGTPTLDDGVVSLWNAQPVAQASSSGIALDRPIVLGGGMGPGLSTIPAAEGAAASAASRSGAVAAAPSLSDRLRDHPYARLARDGRFSAFWLAGTISLFGDRLHQVALAVIVLTITGSALQTGLVFLAATLPNLLLGPFAGTFVDRWDQKRTMIMSDLLRAGLVLSIPFVVDLELALVYPLVFLITTISLFFRPAKAAILPRIVSREDLTPANAALWTGETVADIAGYPLAGVFVAFLGTNLALAFWVDSVTYLVSAILLAGLVIPPAVREVGPQAASAIRSFMAELKEGWAFLRGDATLFQSTLVSLVAQISIGAVLAIAVVYADRSLDGTIIEFPTNYAVLEAAIGIGNLIGGFVVGAIGARLQKGSMIIVGFAFMGVSVIVLGLTANVLVAAGAALAGGTFNLVYVIPSQTLFGERTPEGMMGRVIAIRTSIVMGALTGAMAVSAILADVVDAGTIIAATGVLTLIAAGIASLLPAVRDAR
jgi:DHA3 family macrolide efflux protein-like MFS transporter